MSLPKPISWNDTLKQQQRQPANTPMQGGNGYVRIIDVTSTAGVVGNKQYQDAAQTIIQSCVTESPNVRLHVESSYPLVKCLNQQFTLTKSSGRYTGVLNVTLPMPLNEPVMVFTLNGDGHAGGYDTVSISMGVGAELTALSFTGGYPVGQTELKAGDSFQLTGTADAAIDLVEILDVGALQAASITVATANSFTVTGTVANRGTTTQALAASVRVRNAANGIYGSVRLTNTDGGTTDGVDTVVLNNTYPSITIESIAYPVGQQALKGSESASVTVSASNLNTIVYSSPNSELTIDNPNLNEAVKSVSRSGGTYNVSTNNLRIVATRTANNAITTVNGLINIANTLPTITVSTPAARLRSGVTPQAYTITLTASQRLLNPPTLQAEEATLSAWSGSGETYTATLSVADSDAKGTFNWQNLIATSLSGLVVNAVTTGSTYVLGGFVKRVLTVAAWTNREAAIGTVVVNTAKLQCSNLSEGVSGSLNYSYSSTTDEANDTYTVLNGNTWRNNDTPNAVSNTTGTMQVEIEEVV